MKSKKGKSASASKNRKKAKKSVAKKITRADLKMIKGGKQEPPQWKEIQAKGG